MGKYVKVVAVCPFVNGKPCINDGMNRDVLMNGGIAHPCMYWDTSIDNAYGEEPCLIMRAVKKILNIQEPDEDSKEIDVPFEYTRRGARKNGRKKTQI